MIALLVLAANKSQKNFTTEAQRTRRRAFYIACCAAGAQQTKKLCALCASVVQSFKFLKWITPTSKKNLLPPELV